MNQSYSQDSEERNPFAIEDFFTTYTVSRQIALLETLDTILFFADRDAPKGFGREATKDELLATKRVRHSAKWAGEGSTMSASTIRIIRKHLQEAGLLAVRVFFPQWTKEGFKSPITMLDNLDIHAIAMFARQLMCDLSARVGFEAVDKEHHWGGLASIVRRITGFSLFSMDEDVLEATPEERSVKRRCEFDRLLIELRNAKGIAGYYEDVLAMMVRRFGVDWAKGLPW
jgi:hypothetical protein